MQHAAPKAHSKCCSYSPWPHTEMWPLAIDMTRGSSVPFSVSASPLILHSCGKGNDNKMLGILATVTRTLQQKSVAHAVITNMPATVDARSLVPQERERNNNNNNKRMILPCSSQHMLHFSLLQRHVYDACRKSVLLCAEEKL